MSDLSRIRLPSGNDYDIKDTVSRSLAACGLTFKGISDTMITDNSLVITIPKFLLISAVSLAAYLVASYFLDLKEAKPVFSFIKKKLFKNVK